MDAKYIREALGPEVVPVPLGSLREVDANDVPQVSDNPSGDDPSGFGGLLCKGTTPILEFISGDSDSAMRLNYASGDQDPVVFDVPLPNVEPEEAVEIYFRAGVHGSQDNPTLDAEVFFDEGGSKVTASSGSIQGDIDGNGQGDMAEYSITIADTDVPDGASSMSVELTLGSHGTDMVAISALWVEYWRKINYRV